MPAVGKKLHHKVARFYLKAWDEQGPDGSSGRKGKTLAGTTVKPDEDAGERSSFQNAGISCPGDRPWLGEGANEACNKPLVGALINQTNIYFPKTISAILL